MTYFIRNLVVCVFSAIGLAACSDATTKSSSFDKASMDALLSGAVDDGTVIGVSALVYDEGETVYKGTFGLRDRERSQPVELDTVWRIYSMTKPVTSALIMDLQEDGLLSLSDPVTKYIPELGAMQVASLDENGQPVFAPQNPAMTIEDLLLHRAGMGYGIFGDISPIETAYIQADLFDPTEGLDVKMQKLSQLPLIAQPGTGWYYSYSIDVLGRIAEIVTDQRLGDLMAERFFEPLGMTDTGFYVRPDMQARFASNYALLPDGSFALQDDGQASPYLIDAAYQSGGGGLVSTLGDYARFAQMLLDGGVYQGMRVLESETVDMMMTNQMDADDVFMMPWLGDVSNTGFGYGGRVVTNDRFMDWREDYPAIRRKGFLVKGQVSGENVALRF